MNLIQQLNTIGLILDFSICMIGFHLYQQTATNPIQTTNESHFITSINPVVGFVWEGFKSDIPMTLTLVILRW